MKNLKSFTRHVTNLLLPLILASCCCQKNKDLTNSNIVTNNKPKLIIIDPITTSNLELYPVINQDQAKDNLTNKITHNINSQSLLRAYKKNKNTKKRAKLNLIKYDSGLKCEILRNGPSDTSLPKPGQLITTHYTCWQDQAGEPGLQVDSTYERGEPFTFRIGKDQVIRGWDIALMDMRMGDKRRLFIPTELAFGRMGATKLVPGNTDLIYDVEIIAIK